MKRISKIGKGDRCEKAEKKKLREAEVRSERTMHRKSHQFDHSVSAYL